MLSLNKKCFEKIEDWMSGHVITKMLISHMCLAFFYGFFLLLYEIKFFRQLIHGVHPVLIGWAGALAIYDIGVRKFWKKVDLWKTLLLFIIVAGVTTVINSETGIIQGIKSYILAILPLLAFYPTFFLESNDRRESALLKALLGAAIVVFVASFVALMMYMVRFSQVVSLFGMNHLLGIRLYDPRYSDSGILLYGMYEDTNHAAVYSLVFAAYSIWLYRACQKRVFKYSWQNVIGCVFAVLNFIVQICYFPLANSRGGWLFLGIACGITLFFFFFSVQLGEVRVFLRVIYATVLSLVCVLFLLCGISMLRGELSKVSAKIHVAMTEDSKDAGVLEESQKIESSENLNMGLQDKEDVALDNFDKRNDEFGSGRLQIWKEVFELLAKKPILGTGFGNYEYYVEKYALNTPKLRTGVALHNSYFDLLLSYGVVGFVLLMSFWGVCVMKVLKYILKQGKVVSIGTCCSVFSVMLIAGTSLLLSNIFINTTAMYYLMLVITGYLIAETNTEKKEV